MGNNWYENIQKGQDEQQARYDAIVDRQRAAELAAQADEDRITLNTYMADLRKLQLDEAKRQEAETKRKLEEEKQNRILAGKLTIPGAPYVEGDTGANRFIFTDDSNVPVADPEGVEMAGYAPVPTFDLKSSFEDEAGNVVLGQVDANSAYKDKVAGIKTQMQADLAALKEKALKAKGEEKKVLNEQIAGLNTDLIEAENMPTEPIPVFGIGTADPDASSWEELLQGMDIHQEINQRMMRINEFQPSKLWKFFLSKSKKEAVNIQGDINKFTANYRWGGEWFENHPPEELKKFEANPAEYLSENKKEIEKQTKIKLEHIPDKSEFDKVVNTEDGQAALEADKAAIIAGIKEELGLAEGKLTTLTTSIENYTLADDKGYEAEVVALEKEYKKLLEDAAEAKRVGDEKRYNQIKNQAIQHPLHKRLNIAAMGDDITRVVTARKNYVQMFEHAQSVGNLENAQIWQAAIAAADLGLWVEMNEQGLYELGLEGGSPELLEATLSEFLGGDVRLQRRTDGNWHVFDDGKLFRNSDKDTNFWTHDQLADYSRNQVDDAYAAAKLAWQAKVAAQKLEDMETEHEKNTLINALLIEAIKEKGSMERKYLESQGTKFSTADPETGSFVINRGEKYWVFNPHPAEIEGKKGVFEEEITELNLPGLLEYFGSYSASQTKWLDAFIKEVTGQTPKVGVQ